MTLTIILPTINEEENLKTLIPEIYLIFERYKYIEVIVVDDGSDDGTDILMKKFTNLYQNLVFVKRAHPDGLPKAILTGITQAHGELVAWLDADGSMPIRILHEMYERFIQKDLDLIVGSRFVARGGFKGLNERGKTNLFQFLRNLKNSEDRVLAVLLSRFLNIFLRIVLRAGIKDMTSGFILVRRDLAYKEQFIGRYGEYFPVLMKNLKQKKVRSEEYGYVCLPRIYGASKTGNSLSDYLVKGSPYIYYSARKVLADFLLALFLNRKIKIFKSKGKRNL
jgi:glycosyltransferase involved in cell wall biosynthesis